MAAPRKHTTDEILDAARALVLRDGPRKASVAAISKASGAPVGTLYHRFGSRDALVAAAWIRALKRFQQITLAATEEHADGVERGAAMAQASVTFAERHLDDARLLLAMRRDDLLDAAPGEDFADRLAALNAPLMSAVRELARSLLGQADARSIDAVARAVVDLPYAAVRRHAGAAAIPSWLGDDVAAAARTLLRAL
ncbi:MAG TPA: helix-turn-helix domain-containing protein [Solirubrobacteraceae bacterium]